MNEFLNCHIQRSLKGVSKKSLTYGEIKENKEEVSRMDDVEHAQRLRQERLVKRKNY